jgi:hypothetical protein
MPSLARGASTFGFEAVGCLFWPARQDPIAPQARPRPSPYDNGGALLSPGQQRCSIGYRRGWGAESGCGAGARGSWGTGKCWRTERGRGRGWGGSADWPGTGDATSSFGVGRAGEADPEARAREADRGAGGGARRRGLGREGGPGGARRAGGEGWGGKADPEAGGGARRRELGREGGPGAGNDRRSCQYSQLFRHPRPEPNTLRKRLTWYG